MTMSIEAISANSSDEALNESIRRNGPQVAVHEQIEATRAYQRTRQIVVPRRKLEAKWVEFKRRTDVARAASFVSAVVGHQPKAADLRIALEAKAYYTDFLEHWSKASLEEQRRLWDEDEVLGAAARASAIAPIGFAVAPTFNPANFIGDMAKKGVRLDRVKEAITATPADRLTDQERGVIKANKQVLLAALSNAQVIA